VLHAIEYINTNRFSIKKTDDLSVVVTKLKHLYTASLMKDVGLIKAKTAADKIVDKARVSKSKSAKSALRTALELYIVLRTLSMNYYK
jgi:hypothetical protein